MPYTQTSFPGYDPAFDAKTAPPTFGFSSAVVLPANARVISTSGQVGALDADGVMTGALGEQISEAFKNVERALMAAANYGSAEKAWASVYELTTYHVGGVAHAYEYNLENAIKYFGTKTRPAWTAVGVTDLAYEKQLVEIQVRAVAP